MGFSTDQLNELLSNDTFMKGIVDQIQKATIPDTISESLNLLWYDLRPVVQYLYPFKELIPRISRLPRVPADGGNMFHWKRITAINLNNTSVGVSEGNRGGRIAISLQDQAAIYKTIGVESDVTFEARLGAQNLSPDALGVAIQSSLRSLMIGEEQTLILGNASMPLSTSGTTTVPTPTPTLTAQGSGSSFAAGDVYVICVVLSGFGFLNGSLENGIPGQITRTNADGSVDVYGGGSGVPSAEASTAVTAGETVTATVTPVIGAVGYAWYIAQTSGAETLAAITNGNQVTFTKLPPAGRQAVTALQVNGAYVDNSTNALLPDGILTQIFGQVFGAAPGTAMSTNQNLPSGVSINTLSGALTYTMPAGNTGLTVSGTNIAEFDAIMQAAYDQYKLGFDRILVSSRDMNNFMGLMLAQNASAQFRIFFDADAENGRIVAGRRITSYLNKFMGNTLDIEIHPFVPPGTIVFWSDRVPYELSGVPNILEAHVRMDYYQIQWPFRSRRYEYGVYADEVFACYFPPAFAAITNLNGTSGSPSY